MIRYRCEEYQTEALQLNTRRFCDSQNGATTKNRKAFEIRGLAPGNDTTCTLYATKLHRIAFCLAIYHEVFGYMRPITVIIIVKS